MAIEIYCVKCKAKTRLKQRGVGDDPEEWPAGDQGRVRGVRRRQVPYWCDASGDELWPSAGRHTFGQYLFCWSTALTAPRPRSSPRPPPRQRCRICSGALPSRAR